jgi:hypothetical protein
MNGKNSHGKFNAAFLNNYQTFGELELEDIEEDCHINQSKFEMDVHSSIFKTNNHF